jgi:hypothetical protein
MLQFFIEQISPKQEMRWFVLGVSTIALAIIIFMAVSWTIDSGDHVVEGFEETQEIREKVLQEFEKQKGSKPTPTQFSSVLDALTESDASTMKIAAEVSKTLEKNKSENPDLQLIADEFISRTGKKPTLEHLNMVADKNPSPSEIPDLVEKALQEEPVPAFHKNVKSEPSENFEMNVAIIKAFEDHSARRPLLRELTKVREAVNSVDEVPEYVQRHFEKADPIRENVKAALEMGNSKVTEKDIDANVEKIVSGEESIPGIISKTTGIDKVLKEPNLYVDKEDGEFIELVYEESNGEELDSDTAIFLLAKLRSFEGDRKKVYNLIQSMAIASKASSGQNTTEEETPKSQNPPNSNRPITKEESDTIESAVEEWNTSQYTKRPKIGESVVSKMTSVDRAFNMNISDTDRLVLAATRRARGPSHDVYSEGEDMVLRDDMHWEFPGTQMPCPNHTCGDPEITMAQSSLIGTLLDSAEKTNVGTIMPEFVYSDLPPRK